MKSTIVLFSAIFLVGCTQSISPNQYGINQVGSVNRAVQGIVMSVRAVNVDRSTGVGGAAGAGMGAVAGASIGDGGADTVVGAIVGAVVGGLAGAAVEKGAVVKDGHEYVVQTSNGALLTLVQGGEPFAEGAKVIVLYGSPARIIIDNSVQRP
jgi:outer membrane lipoprotein SlyB